MKLACDIEYEVGYVPPRCRKVRFRRENENVTVQLREISEADAPIAIRQIDRFAFPRTYYDHGQRHGRLYVVNYRWFEGKLYARCRLSTLCAINGERNRWASVKDLYLGGYYRTREKALSSLENEAARYLLIDGQLHEQIGEPRYVIHTTGLGGNHGCTDLSSENSYNSNISHKRYFRIDQEEQARQEARGIAERRRDTESFKRLDKRQYDRFEILIPEAVQLQPSKEHGNGDPFLNQLYGITEIGDPVAAGLLSIAAAFSHK